MEQEDRAAVMPHMKPLRTRLSMKLVNWNVEWATPGGRRSPEILERIRQHDPEVICLTETDVPLLDREQLQGHVVYSQADYGYTVREKRRKVLLWSKHKWRKTDDVGGDDFPPGRFVSGVTKTSLGEVTVMGICIPWAGSRAAGPDAKRKRWEDHGKYLEVLATVIERAPAQRLIVVGDFNQRIGQGSGAPVGLRSALREVFSDRVALITAAVGLQGKRAIDHIALSHDLSAESIRSDQRRPRRRQAVRPFRSGCGSFRLIWVGEHNRRPGTETAMQLLSRVCQPCSDRLPRGQPVSVRWRRTVEYGIS